MTMSYWLTIKINHGNIIIIHDPWFDCPSLNKDLNRFRLSVMRMCSSEFSSFGTCNCLHLRFLNCDIAHLKSLHQKCLFYFKWPFSILKNNLILRIIFHGTNFLHFI